MLNKAYIAISLAILGLYAVAAFNGWEFGNPRPQRLPADARSAPGGYRSFHFWHSGYRGGK